MSQQWKAKNFLSPKNHSIHLFTSPQQIFLCDRKTHIMNVWGKEKNFRFLLFSLCFHILSFFRWHALKIDVTKAEKIIQDNEHRVFPLLCGRFVKRRRRKDPKQIIAYWWVCLFWEEAIWEKIIKLPTNKKWR